MNYNHKEKILALRAEGKSYNEIKKEVGCSLSTISFHLGEGQKEKTYARSRDKRSRLRKMVSQLKFDAVCADCEVDYPPHILQFDHVRGVKVENITVLVQQGREAELLEEIKKCDIVCANCHFDRTYKRAITSGQSASYKLMMEVEPGKRTGATC